MRLVSYVSLLAPLLPVYAFPDPVPSDLSVQGCVSCACTQLASHYKDLVLFPDSKNYTVEATAYWDIRSDASPACIFLPDTAKQVATAMKTVNQCQAPFAVRGGGHMNNPGSNNINGGVLIALDSLDTLKVNASKPSISVGPGARWVDVYSALANFKLYAIGGRLKTIGVPGLTLIGGVSYFINKYGFTMDNVLEYDVVLGNGTAVVASNRTNKDLFWALKGGANNFGIVTRFELTAYPIAKISTTIQAYNESGVEAFIHATCNFVKNDDASVGAGAVLTIQKNATTKVIGASLLGAQECDVSPPSRFSEYSKIPATRRIFNVSRPIDWHSQFDTPNQMFRVQYGQHAVKPVPDQIKFMYEEWVRAVDEVADVEGLYPTFVLNIAPKSAASVAKSNGIGNTWGLDDKESYIWWQTSTGWQKAEDDARMTAWSKGLISRLHNSNKAKGLASEFVYMGDAGEYQDVFKGFKRGNVEKMKRIRNKYDQDSVFTELNTGGFKLPT